MVRPRWANMYTVKHGLPSVCQKQPFNHAYYYSIVMENCLFLLFSATSPNFWSPNKSAKLLKSSAVYCVSLQKYSVFSTMQGCIVPPKSNKLIACVWNVAKTCVLDSFKTVILCLSFQRILSIWNQFRLVLQSELLEQVRIPTALPAVSFISAVRLIEGLFCVHV